MFKKKTGIEGSLNSIFMTLRKKKIYNLRLSCVRLLQLRQSKMDNEKLSSSL